MFFDLVSRNSKRNRKDNGLFFVSLLAAIIAFYIILSLSYQDVMLFLQKMESQAVDRLLNMIPVFYGFTLIILFFLIYFASKYQLERRRHEFGVYLMMGMRRTKLFLMLLAEDMQSSAAALMIGLPAAILLAELISLITAKLVGIGIIGHRITISAEAVFWTVAGFLIIKLAAFIVLSGKIACQEIGDLLQPAPEGTKRQLPAAVYRIALAAGILFLAAAYYLAIGGRAWQSIYMMGITMLSGLSGMLLFFFGLREILACFARHNRKEGANVFTFRQLEENIIHQSSTLAISSILILAALGCFGFGVAVAQHYGTSQKHVMDYTFRGGENQGTVLEKIKENHLDGLFGELFQMRVASSWNSDNHQADFHMDEMLGLIEQQPDSEAKDIWLNNLGYVEAPYLISLSDYNHLRKVAGLEPIELESGECAVYVDADYSSASRDMLLNKVLEQKPRVQLNGEDYTLAGKVQSTNLVVDRSITLSFALLVPDDIFELLVTGEYDTYWNAVLKPELTDDKSLMEVILEVNQKLDKTDLVYESYLQNMGRRLFFVVAASYVTIYLAIIFLIVANTVMGVQFLTQQQKTGRRCQTLIRLGATYQVLSHSVKKQIYWYFGIPVGVAVINSIFCVRALFSVLLSSVAQANISTMLAIAAGMILLLSVVEYIYVAAVRRSSNRYLLTLMVPEREE